MSEQELVSWADQKIAEFGLRGLAGEWDMDPGTLHRDMTALREGTPTRVFRALVTARMEIEDIEGRLRDLTDQMSESDQRSLSQIEELNQKIKELASAVAEAQAAAEAERAQRQDAARDFLRYWIERLKEAGIISPDDDELHGDAPWIIENGIVDLNYRSLDCAAVALAPDDYVFEECMKKAGTLREGITPAERLQRNLSESRTRQERMALRGSGISRWRIWPDEIWFRDDEEYGLFKAWRQGYAEWERKWVNRLTIFDLFAGPKRFDSIRTFVLARRKLESFGYRSYSDHRHVNERADRSYELMRKLSFLRFSWPLMWLIIAAAAAVGAVAYIVLT